MNNLAVINYNRCECMHGHYSVFIDQFDRIVTDEPDVTRHVLPANPDVAGHSGTKLVIGSATHKICRLYSECSLPEIHHPGHLAL